MKIYVIKYSNGWRRNQTVETEALDAEMARARLMLALPTAAIHSVELLGE